MPAGRMNEKRNKGICFFDIMLFLRVMYTKKFLIKIFLYYIMSLMKCINKYKEFVIYLYWWE